MKFDGTLFLSRQLENDFVMHLCPCKMSPPTLKKQFKTLILYLVDLASCVFTSGTFNIGRKDRLWKNYHRLMLKHGKIEVGNRTL